MISGFKILSALSTGASDTKHIYQTPPAIIKRTSESVDGEIKCSHNITNYQLILWYKQDKHKALKFLGYLNMNFPPNIEEDVKGKISFDGDGQKHSGLTILDLKLDDSAVYFCAASYTVLQNPQSQYKNSPSSERRDILQVKADLLCCS
uniref:Immunoglobulin V-set domain-containing protein n=1 Tax=Amphiprion ocellaris TaxID=80972 RepID=A0AAQ5XKI0_AMPOC